MDHSLLNKLMHPIIAKERFEEALKKTADEIPEELRPRYRSTAQREALEACNMQEFDEFVRMFSPVQQRAIKHFLTFIDETYPETHDLISRALVGYWDRVSE